MLKLSHKKLDVWKKSMLLIKKVYIFSKTLPSEERFNLISQMRRSSISVASNIAEGFSRLSNQEKKRFIEISRSSLVELDTQFEVCIEVGYTKVEELTEFDDIINHVFAMLTNLLKKYE